MLVTRDNFGETIEKLERCKSLAVDTETTGLYPWQDDLLCGIAVEGGGEAYYFPFRHAEQNLPITRLAPLRRLLCNPDTVYLGFNYGFDLHFMHKDGIGYAANIEDVQIAAHLLNENEASGKLKDLGDKYVAAGASEEDKKLNAILKEHKLRKNEMWKLPAEMVEPYACQDVVLTRKLRDFYVPHLDSWRIRSLWEGCNDYLLAICAMEHHGCRLDLNLMDTYTEEATTKTEECRAVLHKLAGYEINPNSHKQLQKWLKLKSTAKDVLEKYPNRPGVKELQAFRGWSRVYANYYRKFAQRLDSDGRLHANLNLVGTETGRLSGRDPPLHAIPRYTDTYRVKDVFVAEEDHVLVEADYSQAEMRVASHYGGDARMSEKLCRGADIHTETSEEIGIPRDAAKRLNFSIVYGIGAKTLGQNLGIPVKQARGYLDKYHNNYPGFKRLYLRAESIARHRGYIRMFTGRMRHYNTERTYEHKASSNLVQGTVGEMLRIAITRIHKELRVPMWLTVHDSILFELPRDRLQRNVNAIRAIMEDTPWCSIPMKVDIKLGPSWGGAVDEQEFFGGKTR